MLTIHQEIPFDYFQTLYAQQNNGNNPINLLKMKILLYKIIQAIKTTGLLKMMLNK